jgi:hypothetical protein
MAPTDDLRSKLRNLRDRLAIEAPRARTRPDLPQLAKRLQTSLEKVQRLHLATASGRQRVEEDVCEEAIAEAHLALHDWERVYEQSRPKPKSNPAIPVAAAVPAGDAKWK